jgi:hypothetical protein
VQARSAQKAADARASLEQEAAERDKAEAKAGKQLERVHLQMAEWARPLLIENMTIHTGWSEVAKVGRPKRRQQLFFMRCVLAPTDSTLVF